MAKVNSKRLSQVSTSSAFESHLEFDSKDDAKTKEIDEMKARIAQMEKSMRWWNQCANNWRLKWTDVRNERNKLKDECRSLKNNLEDFESKYSLLEIELEKLRAQNSIHSTFEHESNSQRTLTCGSVTDYLSPEMECSKSNSVSEQSAFLDSSIELSKLSFKSLPKIGSNSQTISTSKIDVSTDTSDLSSESSVYRSETVDCQRMSDLKHAHKQLKKVLQEKCVELTNALRKVDTYENEIKKLRLRTDELRKELVVAEDHADTASNTIRKLQRSNDKLQEQMNEFRVGVD